MLLLLFIWMCEWCTSNHVCIVAVLSVSFQINPMCVVCVVTSD